jgi:hypothetical protein
VRGAYTPGFNATNSGIMPGPGLTYANYFMDYSFDEAKTSDGQTILNQGTTAVYIDISVFEWVSKKKILGADYALAVALPVTNSSLNSVKLGAVGGGGGFADLYVQPVTLGWRKKRAEVQLAYAFFAPTGRYTAGATDNVGTGYWTNTATAGETIYLTKNKGTSLSAYQMYEFHGTQTGTDIKPGSTFDLDYSLLQILPLKKNLSTLLQLGLVGYEQWQITDASGSGLGAVVPGRYTVNALGGAVNVILPERKAVFGARFFEEFSNLSTVQGYSLQITGGITF